MRRKLGSRLLCATTVLAILREGLRMSKDPVVSKM